MPQNYAKSLAKMTPEQRAVHELGRIAWAATHQAGDWSSLSGDDQAMWIRAARAVVEEVMAHPKQEVRHMLNEGGYSNYR